MKKWVKIADLPGQMILDGKRVRYKKHVLGFIRSAWNRGIWITPKKEYGEVKPWLAPEGKTLREIADDLQVEVCQ